jgi:hypothetical protein
MVGKATMQSLCGLREMLRELLRKILPNILENKKRLCTMLQRFGQSITGTIVLEKRLG